MELKIGDLKTVNWGNDEIENEEIQFPNWTRTNM